MPLIDRMIQIVTRRKFIFCNYEIQNFPLTNSLNVRESRSFVESSFLNSFISIFISLTPTSLNNLCSVNPFPLANSSFHLSDVSESNMKKTIIGIYNFLF